MESRQILSIASCGVLLMILSMSNAEVRGPQRYALCYQNITTDRAEEGVIQLFGLAINKTNLVVQGDNSSFYNFETVMMANAGEIDTYNNTPPFSSKLRKPDPVSITSSPISSFGMIVSSDHPVGLFGIKSDKGTADGYYLFPQTNNSVEFMIVAWPRIDLRPFLVMIMVIPVEDGTCVELYKIFDGTNYYKVTNDIMIGKYQVFRYFAGYESFLGPGNTLDQNLTVGEDVTGMYLNASKPVQVITGCECAWVPTPNDLFCDYMAETMAPNNQLGVDYIVPPILGRSADAGYIVRVVPAYDNTVIKYMNGQTVTKRLGQFLQFDQPKTDTYTVVSCDKPCGVHQYNKGYLSFKDIPTDPFQMLTIPNDRFTAGAPFGTASFCEDMNDLIDFVNFMSIVTFDAYKDDILFDGSPIADQFSQGSGLASSWVPVEVNGVKFAVAAFFVKHGFHFVSMSAGKSGSFGVYAYGHSQDPSSSSGYGFNCNYNSTGDSSPTAYKEAVAENPGGGATDLNATCTSEAALVGSVITSNTDNYVPFPFTLTAAILPNMDLTDSCMNQYHDQLLKLLQDFSRKINYWICVSQNCSYLQGEGVAINYKTLSVSYIGTKGRYSEVQIYVEMDALMSVSADDFATCRAEIQNYMYYFINWPPAYSQDLLHQIAGSGCPWPIKWQKPQFFAAPRACPAYY